jgi:phosphonatase-like hydrolase
MRTVLKLAIFDLAGTTVHDEDNVTGCLLDALAAAGFAVPFAEVNARMGIPKPVAIAEVVPAGTSPELIETIHQDFRRRIIHHYQTAEGVSEIAGAGALFRELRQAGVKVGIDTGFDRETTEAIFTRLGWHDEIDASATSDEVPHGRPFPDLAERIMAEVGSTPAETAKIGDTPSDLGEGTAAGCRWVVGVTYGTHRRDQLATYPHTHLVDSVAELSDLLRRASSPM